LALVKSYPGGDDPRWLELLAITESVKGFRDVRYRAMEKAQARAAEILGSLG
jgi:hypothetical protein